MTYSSPNAFLKQQGRIIYLIVVLTNNDRLVHSYDVTPTIYSDHELISVTLNYVSLERDITEHYNLTRSAEEAKAIEAIRDDPKYFFNYAKKYSKTKTDIGPFLDNNQNPINSPALMADMLKIQYETAFSQPEESKRVTDPIEFFHGVDPTKPSFTDLNFSAKDIEKALSKLKASSAAGPDGLSASLLKNCRSTLSLPIYNIWRESLNTGTIPNVLKTATIVPIYKGDSRAVPKNYRPVSLTSHLIKTFERVI